MKNKLKGSVIIVLAVWIAVALGSARAASVTAALEPSTIALGEAAQLTVTVQGRDADEPQIPAVSGLDFQPDGQSSQIQIINGAMSAQVSFTYVVTPSRTGSFTIPAIQAGQGADMALAEPVILKVNRGGNASALNNSNQNSPPAPAVNDDADQASTAEQPGFGFLRIVSPKQEFYVGEMVPVELKAFFRDGVELQVDGLPTLDSDAFTMNKLGDQPVRSQQLINGETYTVFTWPTTITAVKAGDYALSIELPTTVTVRQPARLPRSSSGDPFDDDFMDQAFNNFFGAATQKQVTLNSDPDNVKTLTLPTEDRPASFTGAVGQFDLTAKTTPAQIAVGDPVTLRLKISGVGNFDRVAMPVMAKSGAWKTYQPGAKFEPADSVGSAGYAGTKTFEQALVPTQAGKQQIPALAFSYFDPKQKQYVTRTTPAMTIEVAPGQSSAASAPSFATPLAPASIGANIASDLAPNQLTPGHFTATLRPWFLNPWLVAGALLPSVAVLLIYFILRRRQQLACDPQQIGAVNAQRELRVQLETMERAAGEGDAGNFFAAACAAFQNLLGLRWSLPPRTITLAEINARLGEANGLRTIFGLADEAVYTGRAFASDELRRLQMLVNHELKKLEAL